jgi:uncharacterized protein YodC (DUF2158 family)
MGETMVDEYKFNAGDLVKLRSGGPTMTVAWNTPGEVGCYWWNDASAKFETTVFVVEALQPDAAA